MAEELRYKVLFNFSLQKTLPNKTQKKNQNMPNQTNQPTKIPPKQNRNKKNIPQKTQMKRQKTFHLLPSKHYGVNSVIGHPLAANLQMVSLDLDLFCHSHWQLNDVRVGAGRGRARALRTVIACLGLQHRM